MCIISLLGQTAELFVYRWLCAHAMFKIAGFFQICHSIDVISNSSVVLIIINFAPFPMLQLNKLVKLLFLSYIHFHVSLIIFLHIYLFDNKFRAKLLFKNSFELNNS